jgi:hypothetical protein
MGSGGMSGHGRCRSRWTWALVWKRSTKPWRGLDRASCTVIKGHRAPVSTFLDVWEQRGSRGGGPGEAGRSTTSLLHGGGGPSHRRRSLCRMMRRPARRCRGSGRSWCATMSGGSIRHWDIRPQRRSISVRTSSRLFSLSLFFVLTMGYASQPQESGVFGV